MRNAQIQLEPSHGVLKRSASTRLVSLKSRHLAVGLSPAVPNISNPERFPPERSGACCFVEDITRAMQSRGGKKL